MISMGGKRIASASTILICNEAIFLPGDGRRITDCVLQRTVAIARLYAAFFFGRRFAAKVKVLANLMPGRRGLRLHFVQCLGGRILHFHAGAKQKAETKRKG